MYWKLMNRLFQSDIAIDLGTDKTIIFVKGQGIVINEPSYIALRKDAHGDLVVHAAGNDARKIWGKNPKAIQVYKPLQSGVIVNIDLATQMIKYFFKKAGIYGGIKKPRIMIAAPYEISIIERRAFFEVAGSLNPKSIHLIEEPLAAAIGSGVTIEEPRAQMLVDMGSGTTEVAVFALGGIAHSNSIRLGGDDMIDRIIKFFQNNKQTIISRDTAEFLKVHLGNALKPESRKRLTIKGLETQSRIPKILETSEEEIYQAIYPICDSIVKTIKKAYENLSPSLSTDLIDSSIQLSGGGSLLKNFDRLIEQEMGLPAQTVLDPIAAVAIGQGRALDYIHKLS